MSGALEVRKPVDLPSVLGRADVAATCPHPNVDRSGEPRGVRDESVELAVLTAGVHSARQIANERLIVGPAAKLSGRKRVLMHTQIAFIPRARISATTRSR